MNPISKNLLSEIKFYIMNGIWFSIILLSVFVIGVSAVCIIMFTWENIPILFMIMCVFCFFFIIGFMARCWNFDYSEKDFTSKEGRT